MTSENHTEANESIAGWLNGLPVSMQIICHAYAKCMQVFQSVPNIEHEDDSSQDDIIGRESIEDEEEEEDEEGEGQDSMQQRLPFHMGLSEVKLYTTSCICHADRKSVV